MSMTRKLEYYLNVKYYLLEIYAENRVRIEKASERIAVVNKYV